MPTNWSNRIHHTIILLNQQNDNIALTIIPHGITISKIVFLFLSEERCAQQSCVICPQVDVICTCGALYVAKPRWLFYVVAQRGGYCASRTSSTRGGGAAFARGRVVVVNSFYLFLSNDNFDFCFLVYLVSSFPQPPLTTLVVSNTA